MCEPGSQPSAQHPAREQPADLRRNLASFSWDIEQWERENKWVFVDGSLHPKDEPVTVGDYDPWKIICCASKAIAARPQHPRISGMRIG